MSRRGETSLYTSIVEANDLNREIDGTAIVNNVSLSVPEGNIVLLSGQSGSGKSTVLRMIAGVEEPTSGVVKLFGNNLSVMRQRQRTKLIASKVGVGFQSPNLHGNLTARDNFYGLAEARGQKIDYGFGVDILGNLGLTHTLDKKAAVLSGGEKMRLALARILLTKPELLLLDEPTAPLGEEAKTDVMSFVADTCRSLNASALIVTHEVDIARPFADTEFIMSNGHVVETLMHRLPGYKPEQEPVNVA